MKNLLTFGIVTLFLANMSFASAEVGGTITRTIATPQTYSTAEAFLEAEGDTCEVATDGINVILVEDGKFTLTTLAFVENPVYSCTKERDPFIDIDQYDNLENDSAFILKTELVIESKTTSILDKAVVRIDELIAATKLTKIVKEKQVERITKLAFIKDKILFELARR